MPLLVTLDEVQKLLNAQTLAHLNKNNLFEAVEAEAARLVRDQAGLTLPADVNARDASLDWVTGPMAWIIEFIVLTRADFASETMRLTTQRRYDEAMAIVARHRQGPQTASVAPHLGTMEGLY